MRPRWHFPGNVTLAVILVSITLLGCPKRPEVVQAPPAPPGPPTSTPAPPPAPVSPEVRVAPQSPAPAPAPAPTTPSPAPVTVPLKDVFFDFDRATIRDDQKPAVTEDVSWLRANPSAKVLIEGHCDERGTAEYNLALGERRANAAKGALVAAGIAPERVSTITYGKERPFALGHDEAAWKLNRRAHFVLQKQ